LQADRLRSPIECLEGRHGKGSDAQQQRKEEAKAGQEQEERRLKRQAHANKTDDHNSDCA
jgi:hypothetical protein